MMGDAWRDRLSEYLDGELYPADARELELHLQGCESCRQSLAELRTVVARLASDPVLPTDQPSNREWQVIRRAIPAPRRRWVAPAAIAASLAGLAVLGALLRPRDQVPAATAALPGIYVQASADLESIVRQNRNRLRPETVKALEASLSAIDSAIAQAERALAADPANEYVTRSVGQLRDARLTVLRRAAAVAHTRGL